MQEQIDIQGILTLLPHRYPFILIDRVIEYVPNESIIAIKNVTMNEPFFQGHFPGIPVMPGVLILEAMAQATCILAFKTLELLGKPKKPGDIFLFAGADKVRFKRPVTPGDQLKIESVLGRSKAGVWKSAISATVDGKLACRANILAFYKSQDT